MPYIKKNDGSWPVLTDIDSGWHTQNGNIYQWSDQHNCWRQVECYLASVPTQYGCTTYAQQFNKLTSQLGTRLHPLHYRQPMRRLTMLNGRLVREDCLDASGRGLVPFKRPINSKSAKYEREKHYNDTQSA
ncbi:hypothetical protein FJB73_23040 [Salmonella enterica subsp. enterica]|nr:hypothetical protein [Salmonella enterica subsp. enterica]